MRRWMTLMAIAYFVQVLVSNPGILALSLALYLKEDLQLGAASLGLFSGLVYLPWMLKPALGVVVDHAYDLKYPLQYYFVVCYGVVALILLQLSRLSNYSLAGLGWGAVAISSAIAFSDVLIDKIMVVEGKAHGNTAELQSAQWAALGLGGMISLYVGGWIAQNLALAQAFGVTLLPVLLGLVTIPLLLNRGQPISDSGALRAVASSQSIWRSLQKTLRVMAQLLRSRAFGFVLVLMLLLSCSYLPPVLFYERDVLKWSQEWIGVLGSVGSLGTCVGAIAFGWFSKQGFAQPIPTSISGSATRLPQLCLGATLLACLSWGLFLHPTGAMAAYGLNGFANIVAVLSLLEYAMPLCEVGVEGSVYSVLLACLNLTAVLGTVLGGGLYDAGLPFFALIGLSVLLVTLGWVAIAPRIRS